MGRMTAAGMRMREVCPVCGLRLLREPGWFLVAMLISYALGVPVLLALTLLLWWFVFPDWQLHWVVLVAVIPFVLAVPLVVQYSRVLAVHISYLLDPK
jgi:hypothetical protein